MVFVARRSGKTEFRERSVPQVLGKVVDSIVVAHAPWRLISTRIGLRPIEQRFKMREASSNIRL